MERVPFENIKIISVNHTNHKKSASKKPNPNNRRTTPTTMINTKIRSGDTPALGSQLQECPHAGAFSICFRPNTTGLFFLCIFPFYLDFSLPIVGAPFVMNPSLSSPHFFCGILNRNAVHNNPPKP